MEIILLLFVFISMAIGWLKIGARDDTSRQAAKSIGQLTYMDFEGKTRLVSNNHLCIIKPIGGIGGIYLRECDQPKSEVRKICNTDYIDVKTKEVINPAKEEAKRLLTKRLAKARETNSNEMIFVIKRHAGNIHKGKERIDRIKGQPFDLKMLTFSIEGNCYCTVASGIDASFYDKHTWDEELRRMYVVKSISHKDHYNWRLDFYMSIETGLLVRPTEAQLKMEQFIKENLSDRYKYFTEEEIEEFRQEFNQEQMKRRIIMERLIMKDDTFIDDIWNVFYNGASPYEYKKNYKGQYEHIPIDEGLVKLDSKNYSILIGDQILEAEEHNYLPYKILDNWDSKEPYTKEVADRRIKK